MVDYGIIITMSGPKMKDLTGLKVNRLTVLSYAYKIGRRHYWLCECECGNTIFMRADRLTSPNGSKSCGCLRDEVAKQLKLKHGLTDTPEHFVWMQMKQRCMNPKSPGWERYGGRGITVCERWLGEDGFQNFITDMDRRPEGKYSLERRDNNGNYEP